MFDEWLMNNKNFTEKSARDARSRLKRIQYLIGDTSIPDNILSILNNNSEFKRLTMSVRSQLRRTAKLYLEYLKQ